MDPDADPDPAIFVSDLQDVSKIFFQSFFCLLPLLSEGTFTSFGSIPLANDPDADQDPAIFVSDLQDVS
jgi:hypothetical protein